MLVINLYVNNNKLLFIQNNRIVDNEPKLEAIIIRTIFGFLFNITDTPIKSNKSIKKLNIIIKSTYITIYHHLLDYIILSLKKMSKKNKIYSCFKLF